MSPSTHVSLFATAADQMIRYSEILDYHNVDTNGDPGAEAHGQVPRPAE